MNRVVVFLVLAWSLAAQPAILPLSAIKAGQKGVGRTVFEGTKISEFGVEVLGVLPNIGPKQSIILAKLTGPEMERAGVLQGMSGSPVYIEGKLAGAVALAFSFSKEPIAGIRPIEDMLKPGPAPGPRRASLEGREQAANAGEGKLVRIATPVSFAGFTPRTIEQFGPQLRKLGFEPRQAISGGSTQPTGKPTGSLEPGAMISVQLMSGDMAVAADGTVTHVEGKKIYGFGHPFLELGSTDLPFARASVITLMPNLNTSFKLSSALELLGTITADQAPGIQGELGRMPDLIPLTIAVRGPGGNDTYRMQMVRDPLLSPFLLQMAAFACVEDRQRVLGTASLTLRGRIEFEGNLPPINLDAAMVGDYNVPAQLAQAAAFPLQAALQGTFPLRVRAINLQVDASLDRNTLQVDQLISESGQPKPGDTVDLLVTLAGEAGKEERRRIPVRIPASVGAGPVTITVSDALSVAYQRYMKLLGHPPASAAEWIADINQLAQTNRLYVRVTKSDLATFQVRGEDLIAPPASVVKVLQKEQGGQATAVSSSRAATLAEMEVPFPGFVVSGSKSLSIRVKERE